MMSRLETCSLNLMRRVCTTHLSGDQRSRRPKLSDAMTLWHLCALRALRGSTVWRRMYRDHHPGLCLALEGRVFIAPLKKLPQGEGSVCVHSKVSPVSNPSMKMGRKSTIITSSMAYVALDVVLIKAPDVKLTTESQSNGRSNK